MVEAKHILVTGATGFVGGVVLDRLAADGHDLTLAVRKPLPPALGARFRTVEVGQIGRATDWRAALQGRDAVVHLAGVVQRNGVSAGELDEVNAGGTASLAEQAAEAGLSRLVFVSSIGAVTPPRSQAVVTDDTPPAAPSPYGRSKLAAERHVAAFAEQGGVGISLRPPMVYGAGAGGKWRLLQRLAASPLPLPFGAAENRRTMISVDNLADAIAAALTGGASGAYAVADAETLTLRAVIAALREGMGRRPNLLPVPLQLMAAPLSVLPGLRDSLLGDLVIDASRFVRTFGWTPPERALEAVRRAGAGFAALSRR